MLKKGTGVSTRPFSDYTATRVTESLQSEQPPAFFTARAWKT
jgi:hypothetical protein